MSANKVQLSELYKRGEAVTRQAQEIVDRVSRFKQFRNFQNLDQPEHRRPRLLVISTFEPGGLWPYIQSADPTYGPYIAAILHFLGFCNGHRKWWRILAEERDLHALTKHFEFTLIATTLEHELAMLKCCRVDVLTSQIADYFSDEDFLRQLNIKSDP